MRKKIIAANWKMHKTIRETSAFFSKFNDLLADLNLSDEASIIICPPFTALQEASKSINANAFLGSQDVFYEDFGAFTSNISAVMLKDLSCSHALVGHSERRQYNNEDLPAIKKKVKSALKHGLTPLYCFGEKSEIKQAGNSHKFIEDEINEFLEYFSEDEVINIMFFYEPVWAISSSSSNISGESANKEYANEIASLVRSLISGKFGEKVADAVHIGYGGSVNPSNIREFLSQENIDGCLIGSASLDPEKFIEIIKNALE